MWIRTLTRLMQIEQEKFDSIKELSEIQQKISLGLSELSQIKKDSEAYMVVRENAALSRVSEILLGSKKSLDEISKNHQELTAYKLALEDAYQDVKKFGADLMLLFSELNVRLDLADAVMEKRKEAVEEILKDIKIQRVSLKQDREQMDRDKALMRDAKRLLVDREAMLKRGFDELKRVKEITQ